MRCIVTAVNALSSWTSESSGILTANGSSIIDILSVISSASVQASSISVLSSNTWLCTRREVISVEHPLGLLLLLLLLIYSWCVSLLILVSSNRCRILLNALVSQFLLDAAASAHTSWCLVCISSIATSSIGRYTLVLLSSSYIATNHLISLMLFLNA